MTDSTLGLSSAWNANTVYALCAELVHNAKQLAFPRGSVRRGDTRELGAFETPFGRIALTVNKDSYADLYVDHLSYEGKLLAPDGAELGRCEFATYRTVRGSFLDHRAILYELDAISEEAIELGLLLAAQDYETSFEDDFYDHGILLARLLHIAPAVRGGLAWKVLYFATMSAVFAHQKRVPDRFVFKAFPLTGTAYFTESSPEDTERRAADLRRFYALHLGAKRMTYDGKPTYHMQALVPAPLEEGLRAIWADEARKRREAKTAA